MMNQKKRFDMKRLACIIFGILVLNIMNAAEPRLAGWGAYSYGKGVSVEPRGNTTFNTAEWGPKSTTQSENAASGVSMGVDYRICSKLWIGATFTTGGKFTETAYITAPNTNPIISGSYKSSSIFINGKMDWLKLKNIHLYSRCGVGVGFTSKIDIKFLGYFLENPEFTKFVTVLEERKPCKKFVWQLSLVGAEYKFCRFLGLFTEGGIGNQGSLLCGARLYFL